MQKISDQFFLHCKKVKLMDEIVFQDVPIVMLASNTFINVPQVFVYETTPLIEVVNEVGLGLTTQIPIYHADGTYLAKVVGTRIYKTKEGAAAGVVINKHADTWVCELEGRELFEIKHQPGEAFKVTAELHTPDGYFVKWNYSDPKTDLLKIDGSILHAGQVMISGSTFRNVPVGIRINKDGGVMIAGI